jgi:putative ABC transport system permease protein
VLNKTIENVVRDVKYGMRSLLAARAFAAVAVTTLALGIGLNTAVFSVVNAVLFRPFSFRDPDRIVMAWDSSPDIGARTGSVSYPDFLDWKEHNHVFEIMAAYVPQSFNLVVEDQSERIEALRVSPELFGVLQIYPSLGQPFSDDDQRPGHNHLAVITHGLWQRRFGGRDSVIGQSLTLDAEAYTVVGVLPAGFQPPPVGPSFKSEVFVPLLSVPVRGGRNLRVIARLRRDVTLRGAQAEMDRIAQQLGEQYPDTNASRGVNLVPLHEQLVGNVRPALLILLGAVGLVLLISCANASSLVLARAAVRQRELAIRAALGASRWRLIQQVLSESLLLGVLGGGMGLLLALLGTPLLVAIIPGSVPRAEEITLDGTVLAFTGVVSILAGIVSGVAPAVIFSKPNLNEALAEAGRTSSGGTRRTRIRSFLVITEIALASVLLIAAGLMIKSFLRLQQVDPGFTNMNVLTMTVSLSRFKYSQPQLRADFFRRTIEGTKALRGVESAAVVNTLPLTFFDQSRSVSIEGYPRALSDLEGSPGYRTISPAYFEVMGIPLLAGRPFTERDDASAPGVAIINDAMARHFWPEGDSLGKHVTISPDKKPVEIIGVAGDVNHHGLDMERDQEIYVPCLQRPELTMFLLVRPAHDSSSLIAPLREAVRAIDSGQPVYNIMTMAQRASDSIASWRFPTLVLGIFAAGALVIAVAGIYGLVSYTVAQRTREIGIRMALGAQPHNVLNPILRQGMALAMSGLVLGLVGAWGSTRILANLLFGVTATDLITFAGVSILLAGIALLGTYVPARKATRVDPMAALRSE